MAKKGTMSLSSWWKEYSTYIYIGGAIFFFVLIILLKWLYPEWFETQINIMNEIHNDLEETHRPLEIPSQKSKTESKGEIQCKKVAEKLFNRPFKKIRPDFLKSELTGKNLELDIYNEELKLAIEYDGIQHYKYSPFFHKNGQSDFEKQKQRDLFKEQKCIEHGIKLIRVPYLIKNDEIEGYIKLRARELGLLD
jgi:hypothetical protein